MELCLCVYLRKTLGAEQCFGAVREGAGGSQVGTLPNAPPLSLGADCLLEQAPEEMKNSSSEGVCVLL